MGFRPGIITFTGRVSVSFSLAVVYTVQIPTPSEMVQRHR